MPHPRPPHFFIHALNQGWYLYLLLLSYLWFILIHSFICTFIYQWSPDKEGKVRKSMRLVSFPFPPPAMSRRVVASVEHPVCRICVCQTVVDSFYVNHNRCILSLSLSISPFTLTGAIEKLWTSAPLIVINCLNPSFVWHSRSRGALRSTL